MEEHNLRCTENISTLTIWYNYKECASDSHKQGEEKRKKKRERKRRKTSYLRPGTIIEAIRCIKWANWYKSIWSQLPERPNAWKISTKNLHKYKFIHSSVNCFLYTEAPVRISWIRICKGCDLTMKFTYYIHRAHTVCRCQWSRNSAKWPPPIVIPRMDWILPASPHHHSVHPALNPLSLTTPVSKRPSTTTTRRENKWTRRRNDYGKSRGLQHSHWRRSWTSAWWI